MSFKSLLINHYLTTGNLAPSYNSPFYQKLTDLASSMGVTPTNVVPCLLGLAPTKNLSEKKILGLIKNDQVYITKALHKKVDNEEVEYVLGLRSDIEARMHRIYDSDSIMPFLIVEYLRLNDATVHLNQKDINALDFFAGVPSHILEDATAVKTLTDMLPSIVYDPNAKYTMLSCNRLVTNVKVESERKLLFDIVKFLKNETTNQILNNNNTIVNLIDEGRLHEISPKGKPAGLLTFKYLHSLKLFNGVDSVNTTLRNYGVSIPNLFDNYDVKTNSIHTLDSTGTKIQWYQLDKEFDVVGSVVLPRELFKRIYESEEPIQFLHTDVSVHGSITEMESVPCIKRIPLINLMGANCTYLSNALNIIANNVGNGGY